MGDQLTGGTSWLGGPVDLDRRTIERALLPHMAILMIRYLDRRTMERVLPINPRVESASCNPPTSTMLSWW